MAKPPPPSKPLPPKQPPAPWMPAPWELPDAYAIQALCRGEATPEQQVRALRWIVEVCAGTYDMAFRPGDGGARETDFAEGKRFVGNSVVKLSKVNTANYRKGQND